MATPQNYINHIVLVLDASGSMASKRDEVVAVADEQIAYLAQRSRDLDQETRITVYTFDYASHIQCVFYDKDVLRMPSLRGHYTPNGQTALIDATLKSLDDLKQTPQLYGDHAFLVYVLTDGQENDSRSLPNTLSTRLGNLPDNWTVAVLTPDQRGVFEAKKFGFPTHNIAVWDATGKNGVREAGETIRQATESFMSARSSGIRGYNNLFQLNTQNLTPKAVKTVLGELHNYNLLNVSREANIRDFVESKTRRPYILGSTYYQLTKREEIQAQKNVAIMDRATGKVYSGTPARSLLGLPSYEVKVGPDFNPNYDVFVQSTSVNRKLVPGTKVLVLQN